MLSAAEGLHNLRKTLEDEWFKETLKDRPANQQLIEEFETCCHSPQSPHLPNDNTLHPNSVPLDPMSQFRRIWDFLQIKILMYIAIFVPFRVCFDAPALPWSWDFILDIAVDIYFVADIILCFNTAYQRHSDGKMEWSRRLVTRHYLKTWFLIDLVASLPINYIPFIADAGERYARPLTWSARALDADLCGGGRLEGLSRSLATEQNCSTAALHKAAEVAAVGTNQTNPRALRTRARGASQHCGKLLGDIQAHRCHIFWCGTRYSRCLLHSICRVCCGR